jgi:cytochrome c553
MNQIQHSLLVQFRIHYSLTMKISIAILALAGLAGTATAADVVGDAKRAQYKAELCIGCHGIQGGYKTVYPEVYLVPMIGGQSAKYIESALRAYKKGERNHPSMRGIARTLTDQDIADLAAYYSQQK